MWLLVGWAASFVAFAILGYRKAGQPPTGGQLLDYAGQALIMGPALAGVAAVQLDLVPPVPRRVGRWLRCIAWTAVAVMAVFVLGLFVFA